jgi:arylsulfatase
MKAITTSAQNTSRRSSGLRSLAGPQERYDILMNSFTERTSMAVVRQEELKKVMPSYVKYRPRKVQSYMTARLHSQPTSGFSRYGTNKDGVHVELPAGN